MGNLLSAPTTPDLDAHSKELEDEFDISARGFFPASAPLRCNSIDVWDLGCGLGATTISNMSQNYK